ncbi:MAG: GIY-YIG nuclease family protein [Pseudomonadota bacterium]
MSVPDSLEATELSKPDWVLYLLECNNGAYYAGITNNLEARFSAHLAGKGARYTRANPPTQILATKTYPDRSSASVAEAQLKSLPRHKKLQYFEAENASS